MGGRLAGVGDKSPRKSGLGKCDNLEILPKVELEARSDTIRRKEERDLVTVNTEEEKWGNMAPLG